MNMVEESIFKIKRYSCTNLYLNQSQYGKSIVMSDSLFLRYAKSIGVTNKDIIEITFDYSVKNTINKRAIRNQFYNNGVTVNDIHYVRLFRTVSKAKSGECFFVNDKFFDALNKWQTMQISKLIKPNDNCKLVELEAYKSLTASGIIKTIKIKPSEILIVKDVDSHSEKNCAVVDTDADKHCKVNLCNQQITNTLFDGQALIDDSLFNDNSGMMVLRQHFFKACAFRCDIKKFMLDRFAERYNTAQVRDMFGTKKYVKNIKLITTDNAIKWLKFSNLFESQTKIYKHWCNIVRQSNYEFGVVKTDHSSKYGTMQRMSYQMINSLPLDRTDVENLLSYESLKVQRLKNDDDYFYKYLINNTTEMNGYDMLADLILKGLINTDYVNQRRAHIINDYVTTLKQGKIEVTGDNLTVCQNPLEMLYYSVDTVMGRNIKAIEFQAETDCIQCHTQHFTANTYLASFRNPHNAPNNVGYYHNVNCPLTDKYFNKIGNNIIIINGIETDTEDRANSMDFDSDFQLITDNKIIVKCARQCYADYPTIVNAIKPETTSYTYTSDNVALIDNTLAQSQIQIGYSSNIAQLALSHYWHSKDSKLKDDFIIMSVLAQLSIDSAKRRFDINIPQEIIRIAHKSYTTYQNYPLFFKFISDKKTEFNSINCPMDYVINVLERIPKAESRQTQPIANYIKQIDTDISPNFKQINSLMLTAKQIVSSEIENIDALTVWNICRESRNKIKNYKINEQTMRKMLIISLEKASNIKSDMLKLLYKTHKDMFLQMFTNCINCTNIKNIA